MPLNFKPHCCSPAIDRTFLFSIVKHSAIPSEPVSLRLYLTHAYKGRSCYWRRRKIQTTICSSRFPRISPLGMVDRPFFTALARTPQVIGSTYHRDQRNTCPPRNSFYPGNRNSTLFANATIYIVPDENWQNSLIFGRWSSIQFNTILSVNTKYTALTIEQLELLF